MGANATGSFRLARTLAPPNRGLAELPLRKMDDGDNVRIAGANFSATFSRSAGTLTSLIYGSREMLAPATDGVAGPVLQVWRAPTDNDKGFGNWLARDWRRPG